MNESKSIKNKCNRGKKGKLQQKEKEKKILNKYNEQKEALSIVIYKRQT